MASKKTKIGCGSFGFISREAPLITAATIAASLCLIMSGFYIGAETRLSFDTKNPLAKTARHSISTNVPKRLGLSAQADRTPSTYGRGIEPIAVQKYRETTSSNTPRSDVDVFSHPSTTKFESFAVKTLQKKSKSEPVHPTASFERQQKICPSINAVAANGETTSLKTVRKACAVLDLPAQPAPQTKL